MVETEGNATADGGWQNAMFQNLGHALEKTTPIPRVFGWKLPYIAPGQPTVLVTIPFPVTTSPPPRMSKPVQEAHIMALIGLSVLIWMLPMFCINNRCCCRCFKRFMSRRLSCYFFLAFLLNMTMLIVLIATNPDINANHLFFDFVAFIGKFTDKFEEAVKQAALLVGVFLVFSFRRRIITLLGFDTQLVRCDLRDCLTCFTMSRFGVIEVSILKVEGLSSGITTRTLFGRIVLGYNEALHTRPHDGCDTTCKFRERFQLNYDPEDDTQKLSIVVKQQEVVSSAVSSLAPVVGAMAGAAGGMVTPLGPAGGAGAGVVTGIGAANSLGKEVARIDLSSTQINRLRMTKVAPMASQSATNWQEKEFQKVDLVPQGSLWLRIADLDVSHLA